MEGVDILKYRASGSKGAAWAAVGLMGGLGQGVVLKHEGPLTKGAKTRPVLTHSPVLQHFVLPLLTNPWSLCKNPSLESKRTNTRYISLSISFVLLLIPILHGTPDFDLIGPQIALTWLLPRSGDGRQY